LGAPFQRSARLRGLPRPAGQPVRQRDPQVLAPLALAPCGQRGDAGVVAEERIAAAQRQRAPRPAQAGRGPAAARERPAERVRGAQARCRAPGAAGKPQRAARGAVVGLVQRQLRIGVDAGSGQ